MSYTEEGARKKWCPMVRFYHGHDCAAANRWVNFAKDIDTTEGSRCIASDCMMWRWKSVGTKKLDGYCGLSRVVTSLK